MPDLRNSARVRSRRKRILGSIRIGALPPPAAPRGPMALSFRVLLMFLAVAMPALALPLRTSAEDAASRSGLSGPGPAKATFGPTWKLLSADQKRQFVAGYLQAWQDAGKVTEALAAFSREKPEQLAQSFDKILAIFDVARLSPDTVARELDRIFSDPETRELTLAEAMSSARAAAPRATAGYTAGQ